MLIRFVDDYINDVNEGLGFIGHVQSCLCCKEPFLGNSKILDKMYAYSALVSGIIDHLLYDDNSKPEENVALLLCLRSIIKDDSLCCGNKRPSTIDVRNYHIPVPAAVVNPPAGIPFDEGINQYNP